jgi:hypothetical protein
MAYNRFSLEKVVEQFGLTIKNTTESVVNKPIKTQQASQLLVETLKRNASLAKAIATEKALSEFIVAPILAEIREMSDNKISLFSGIELNLDAQQGLNGRCDFIISLGDNQFYLTAPVVTIVEAKKSILQNGYGQCIAEMVASQLFNERKERPLKTIYGVVTNGHNWQFMSLEAKIVTIENREFSIENVNELLSVLMKMIE